MNNVNADLQRGLEGLANSREAYQEAGAYYKGTVTEWFASARIQRLLGQTGAFYLNYARTAVDARASRIEISAVTVPDDDAATKILQEQVWNANDLILEQGEVHTGALSLGDSYLIVWPGDEEGSVEMHYNTPLGTRLMYSLENPRKAAYGIKVWAEGSVYRANLYYADRVEKYVTVQGNSKQAEDWVEYDQPDMPWMIENPYGEIPVFHFAADGRPYGTPVHINAYGPQNAIIKLNAVNMATIEATGFPQRYALSMTSDVENLDIGADFGEFQIGDSIPVGTGDTGKLRGGPGEIQFFENVKTVGQFDTADPGNFLDPLTFQIKSMAQTTDTPMHYFDPAGGAPSGESLRVADAPLVKSVDRLTLGFTRPWAKALAFAMKVIGRPVAAVNVQWAPSESADDSDGWAVVQQKIDAGMPPAVAFQMAGFTATQTEEWGLSDKSTPADPGTTAQIGGTNA